MVNNTSSSVENIGKDRALKDIALSLWCYHTAVQQNCCVLYVLVLPCGRGTRYQVLEHTRTKREESSYCSIPYSLCTDSLQSVFL